jgi:hypothetical protein
MAITGRATLRGQAPAHGAGPSALCADRDSSHRWGEVVRQPAFGLPSARVAGRMEPGALEMDSMLPYDHRQRFALTYGI